MTRDSIDMIRQPSYSILITGLGALGTVFATFLKNAGHKVYALTKEKYLPVLSDRKLQVTGIWGEHETTIDGVYGSIDPLREKKFDLIIITVKSYDTKTVIDQVKSFVGKNTFVISAQNGYGNYETITEAVGGEHALLARIIFGVKVKAPGRAEVTVIADGVRIGQPHGVIDFAIIEKTAVCADAGRHPDEIRREHRSDPLGQDPLQMPRSIRSVRSLSAPMDNSQRMSRRGV